MFSDIEIRRMVIQETRIPAHPTFEVTLQHDYRRRGLFMEYQGKEMIEDVINVRWSKKVDGHRERVNNGITFGSMIGVLVYSAPVLEITSRVIDEPVTYGLSTVEKT